MTGIIPDVVHLSGGNLVLVIIVFLIALGALSMAYMFRQEVLAAGEGTDNMKNIAHAVQEGANAYLARQFRTLAVFAVVAFLLLLALPADDITVRIFRSLFFLVGAGFSGAVGYLGMSLAVRANLRVAAAANETGREPAMRIGFRTGGMVGMLTVGLGLLGASIVVIAFGSQAPEVLEGFGFGAALLAMFMRVGGGIFTKAADVGRRPGRQGRAEHPRGRPAQRRDHRRQRRRQRRRLRRHGRRPLRVVRRDPGRRADPRLPGLR